MSILATADLPPALGPAEQLGRGRADVELLVARRSDQTLERAPFTELAGFLRAGDLLVVNTSGTLAAALRGRLDGSSVLVHLSTPLGPGRWVVELRGSDFGRIDPPSVGALIELPADGRLTLTGRFRESSRLLAARLDLPEELPAYLAHHGAPIRYRKQGPSWPIDSFQTIFARAGQEAASAEMASAGRPFSFELVTELVSAGVLFAPITLHAGVSSLEPDEAPFPERYEVPAPTAHLVNAVHEWGGRVIAVGTTVTRALETTTTSDGTVRAGAGWTDLLITPERGLRAIDGLLTGWHEPESSHVLMLEAAAERELLEHSYEEAVRLGFVGHEFGDLHLILP